MHFLDTTAKTADTLYILGDLFDSWVGDDDNSSLSTVIKQALRRYSDSGRKVFFMAGNRDFLVGESFAHESGLTLLDDPTIIAFNNGSCLLMHGDTLCTDDHAYQAFRATVRSRQWREEVLSLPLNERKKLAEDLRHKSREANNEKAGYIMDANDAAIINIMQQSNASLLIHGHTHRPATHTLEINGKPATRLVLGDWRETRGWYIRLDTNGQSRLIDFPY